MIRTVSLVLLFAAAACGGKKSAPATTTTTTQPAEGHAGHAGHEGHAEEHAAMPPELTAFHDVLKPRWHAAAGPQRMKDTCAAVPDFKTTADAVAKATPPTKANADTWTTGTRALVAAVGELEAACKTNETGKFEAAFTKVHDSFHSLMMQAGAHGEHGGAHKHQM